MVGYYQACERLDETVLAPVGEKVASKIKAGFEDAIAFVVSADRLFPEFYSDMANQVDGQRLGSAEAALVVRKFTCSSAKRPLTLLN